MTRKLKAISLIATLVGVLAAIAWVRSQQVVHAQDNLIPGMLFGPLTVGYGQHIEICMSNLNEADIVALVHFRNLSTGEVTANQKVTMKSGTGACVPYNGTGQVVGMTRGDVSPVDWVSPSNALIGTMSVLNDRSTQTAVLGVARLWFKGL